MRKLFLKRIFLSLLFLFIGNAFAKGQDNSNALDYSVTLKEAIRIESNIIRIGDIFRHTGKKAEIAIGYAPSAGKRAIYDATWLYRIAKAYQLNWRPLSRHHRIVVERASRVISRDQIASELLTALSDHGVNGNLEIEFSNRALRLYVPENESGEIGFDELNYNPRNNRFTGIVFAPSNDPSAKRIRITGRLHITSEIPVPRRRILSSEIIKKTDIKWIKVRSRRLQTDIIVNLEDLIGKSPRRGLREGLPVRLSAVRRPILVPKGGLVTIVLAIPKMRLTAQGKAIIAGSEGDVIQIKNTQSNKVIEAEVIGTNRVAVRPTVSLAMK